MNKSLVFEDLIDDVKQLKGVRNAEIKMRFMHVTCADPDPCIVVSRSADTIDSKCIEQDLTKLINIYNKKYGLIDKGIYLFFQFEGE